MGSIQLTVMCVPASISKFDERSAFLYVLHNAEDFQIYFCTEMHCRRSVLFDKKILLFEVYFIVFL